MLGRTAQLVHDSFRELLHHPRVDKTLLLELLETLVLNEVTACQAPELHIGIAVGIATVISAPVL